MRHKYRQTRTVTHLVLHEYRWTRTLTHLVHGVTLHYTKAVLHGYNWTRTLTYLVHLDKDSDTPVHEYR